LVKINSHNEKSGLTYTLGINKFSDWTDEEFAAINKLRAPLKKVGEA